MWDIADEIVSGKLGEGEPLPREIDIAAKFNVSRGVARECIRGLEERGLITVKHGRGATVAPADGWDRFDAVVRSTMLATGEGVGLLAEYLECQRILETEAAALAAERASAEDVAELGAALERMTESAQRAAVNPAAERRYHEADIAFHAALFKASRNATMAQITEPIHEAIVHTLARASRPIDRSLPQHRRLFAAIAQADPVEARAAMDDYLRRLEDQLTHAAAPAAA
jgi:GntR family transcriptional repressor for pyruvate dehydrogenase complex